MDFAPVDQIARAVLYEGYLLYPYRTSSLKNCRPCAFGSLYPRSYSLANGDIEPWSMQIECLVRGDVAAELEGAVRFLQSRGGDVCEREVLLSSIELETLRERTSRIAFGPLEGSIELSSERLSPTVFKLRVRINNESPHGGAEDVMLSTHAIFGVHGGRFLSLIDPPEEAIAFAQSCMNRGAWPVLAGDPEHSNLLLAAPIILYDFPEVAPESAGDLFDGTEIDELLTLRILTLTDHEKHAMQDNEHARKLLERTETWANEQRLTLHGTIRRPTSREGKVIGPGDRVIVRPRGRADVLDLALDGRHATIVGVEQDFEGRILYMLVMDDDPGQDLGIEGKPGHRFFFRREELELICNKT